MTSCALGCCGALNLATIGTYLLSWGSCHINSTAMYDSAISFPLQSNPGIAWIAVVGDGSVVDDHIDCLTPVLVKSRAVNYCLLFSIAATMVSRIAYGCAFVDVVWWWPNDHCKCRSASPIIIVGVVWAFVCMLFHVNWSLPYRLMVRLTSGHRSSHWVYDFLLFLLPFCVP